MSFTVFQSYFCSWLCFTEAFWVISFFLISLYLSGTQRVFTKSRGDVVNECVLFCDELYILYCTKLRAHKCASLCVFTCEQYLVCAQGTKREDSKIV